MPNSRPASHIWPSVQLYPAHMFTCFRYMSDQSRLFILFSFYFVSYAGGTLGQVVNIPLSVHLGSKWLLLSMSERHHSFLQILRETDIWLFDSSCSKQLPITSTIIRENMNSLLYLRDHLTKSDVHQIILKQFPALLLDQTSGTVKFSSSKKLLNHCIIFQSQVSQTIPAAYIKTMSVYLIF